MLVFFSGRCFWDLSNLEASSWRGVKKEYYHIDTNQLRGDLWHTLPPDSSGNMFSHKQTLQGAQKPGFVWVSVYSWSSGVLAISFSIKVLSVFNSMPNHAREFLARLAFQGTAGRVKWMGVGGSPTSARQQIRGRGFSPQSVLWTC